MPDLVPDEVKDAASLVVKVDRPSHDVGMDDRNRRGVEVDHIGSPQVGIEPVFLGNERQHRFHAIETLQGLTNVVAVEPG